MLFELLLLLQGEAFCIRRLLICVLAAGGEEVLQIAIDAKFLLLAT